MKLINYCAISYKYYIVVISLKKLILSREKEKLTIRAIHPHTLDIKITVGFGAKI